MKRVSQWWILGAVAGIVLLLYLPTLRYGFVWDDGHLITTNTFLEHTTIPEIFARDFWFNPGKPAHEGDVSYYRPLPILSFFLERREFELSPAGYHLTNILLHVFVVVLFWFVLRELYGSGWWAGFGALFYAVNPAMNCGVTFIANRTYLLAGLLLMLGLLMLLQGRHREEARYRWLRPVVFAVSLLGALLSVEASLVAVVIAAAWLLFNRRQYPDLLHWVLGAAGAVLVYLVLRLGIARISLMPPSVTHWAAMEPLRVINTFGQQLFLFLVPFGQRVIYTVGPTFTSFSVYTMFGLLFMLAPPTLMLARRRPNTALRALLGYSWLVLFLLPFSNLLFLGPSGRMLYLSGIGVVIYALALIPPRSAGTAHRGVAKRAEENSDFALRFQRLGGEFVGLRNAVLVLLGLYLTAFAVQLVRRNEVWFDELSLDQAMVREAPDSPGAHLNLGAELAKRNRPLEAIAQYRLAIEDDSSYVSPHNRLAFALMEEDSVEGAAQEFREVVRLDPNSADARNNLALTLKRAGMLDSAILYYRAALSIAPSDTTLNNLARALLEHGNYPEAVNALKQVLAHQPYFEAARQNLTAAYLAAGLPDSADMLKGR